MRAPRVPREQRCGGNSFSKATTRNSHALPPKAPAGRMFVASPANYVAGAVRHKYLVRAQIIVPAAELRTHWRSAARLPAPDKSSSEHGGRLLFEPRKEGGGGGAGTSKM